MDNLVLSLNRTAAARLRCAHQLAVVPGASQLFEEPGTLDAAARLAAGWFVEHLTAARAEGTRAHAPAVKGAAGGESAHLADAGAASGSSA